MKKIKLGLILAMLACFGLSAAVGCKESTPTSSPEQSNSESQDVLVELANYQATIKTGESVQIEVLNWSGEVTYESQNPAVATVDENGLIYGVADGATTISVVCGEDVLTFEVTVSEALQAAPSLSLNVVSSQIYLNYELQLTPSLIIGDTLADNTAYAFTYQSSNPNVATVNENGLVTGVAEGETTISVKVTVNGTEYTASATISVIDIASVSLNQETITLSAQGDFSEEMLSYTYKKYQDGAFVDAECPAPVWSSSDESIVTVDQYGNLTGVSAGKAVVTLVCGKASATCEVTVHNYYARIFDANGFLAIGEHLDGYFELMNDIDFTDVDFVNPFGYSDALEVGPSKLDNYDADESSIPFTGTLNGNGYTVRNLTHAAGGITDRFERVIFTRLETSAVIENIGFEIFNPNTTIVLGAGICGSNHGTIKNVAVTMTLSGVGTSYNQWGTAGISNLNYGSISECVVKINANGGIKYGTTICLGGIVNTNRGGKISSCLVVVNEDEVPLYSHSGSWGAVSGSVVVKTESQIADNFDKALLSSAIWNTSGDLLPVLKNAKETIIASQAIYAGINGVKGIQLSIEDLGAIKNVALDGKNVQYTVLSQTLTVDAALLADLQRDNSTLIVETGEAVYLFRVNYYALAVDQALKLTHEKALQTPLTFTVADVEGTIEKVLIGETNVEWSLSGTDLVIPNTMFTSLAGELTLSVHTDFGSYNYSLFLVTKYLNTDNIKSFADLKSTLEADMNGYYVLTSNIDLSAAGNNSQRVTRAIGYNGAEFNGTIDGRGFAIQNMEYNWRSDGGHHDHALIQTIGASGVVKNLAVTGITVKTNSARAAGLAIDNKGMVENCFIEYNATNGVSGSNSQWGQAAIVLKNNGTIKDCLAKLTITTDLAANYICLVTDNNGTMDNVNGIVSMVGEGDAGATNFAGGTKTHCGCYETAADFFVANSDENYTSSYWTFDEANATVSFGDTVVL